MPTPARRATSLTRRPKTFIWTAHTENLGITSVTWLTKSDEIIYASERDGWRHLYLIDAKEGKIKNQITSGRMGGARHRPHRRGEPASLVPGQRQEPRPGSVFHPLLPRQLRRHRPGGAHRGQRQPLGQLLARTASTSSTPTRASTCRRSTSCGASPDGKLVCELEEADISELKATGWEPPEVFVAKGRDGKTDIWGIICRPPNFDPARNTR